MSDEKRTRIRKRDGVIFKGDEVGHADHERTVRRPDGWIFRGDEIGYVDADDKVRKPDGWIFKGDVVAQVKERDRLHAKDGIIFPGEEWGYVDEDGNVRQRDGILFKGRVIGHMRGRDKAAALAFFALRFQTMVERFDTFRGADRALGGAHHALERHDRQPARRSWRRRNPRQPRGENQLGRRQDRK